MTNARLFAVLKLVQKKNFRCEIVFLSTFLFFSIKKRFHAKKQRFRATKKDSAPKKIFLHDHHVCLKKHCTGGGFTRSATATTQPIGGNAPSGPLSLLPVHAVRRYHLQRYHKSGRFWVHYAELVIHNRGAPSTPGGPMQRVHWRGSKVMPKCCRVGYLATLARAHAHNFICLGNRGLPSLRDLSREFV